MALELLDSVTSTMDVARDRLVSGHLRFDSTGKLPFQGVMARQQTSGRGQRGRIWYSVPGESLSVTYYFHRAWLRRETAGFVSLLTGVVVAEVLQKILAQEALPTDAQTSLTAYDAPRVGLKWPNDLLLRGKKVGGILVELMPLDKVGWVALIGLGINIHQTSFPSDLAQTATSLRLEGFANAAAPSLGELIANVLEDAGNEDEASLAEQIISRWNRFDETTGRRFQTEYEGRPVVGSAEGIEPSGALRLRLEDGRRIHVLTASSLCAL